jgi:hypothetical protein
VGENVKILDHSVKKFNNLDIVHRPPHPGKASVPDTDSKALKFALRDVISATRDKGLVKC